MSSNKVLIYSDGACSGNPGPGGWGAIVSYKTRVIELGGEHPATTNNRMEMTGVLESLRFCIDVLKPQEVNEIQVLTDSVYVIRGITQWIFGWKRRGWKNAENDEVSNQDIWVQLDEAVMQIKKKFGVTIKWDFVKGHEGVEGNERCDRIAVAYSKNEYISLYDGDAKDYFFDISVMPPIRPLPEMKSKSSGPSKPAWYLSYVNGVLTKHNTWSECEAVVKGRPAKFKKVTSPEEEEAVKKSWGIS